MSWDDSFLTWFAGQSIPMSERVSTLGNLSYHHFSSAFDGIPGIKAVAFGCSPNRKIAAMKCAAETIERKIMHEFFHSSGDETSAFAVRITPGAIEFGEECQAPLPPQGMKTSNGWAVHSDLTTAMSAARLEALERHLLIKSYYKWGWAGFRLRQSVEAENKNIFFMTSRLTSADHIAGIVAAKSSLYSGVSFGYCAGKTEQIAESAFWQPALLEAISKILALGGRELKIVDGPSAWISSNIKAYLETPFDTALFEQGIDAKTQEDKDKNGFMKTFDLGQRMKLDFPLFAAFCWGGNLIPLCDPTILIEQSREYYRKALEANELSIVSAGKHPIL
jgi:hypothetical protein